MFDILTGLTQFLQVKS